MAFLSFWSDACLDASEDAAFVRVKMSWARERLGYFAYCGSEPMMMDFRVKWGLMWEMMRCRSECESCPACHGVTGQYPVRL